MWFYKILLYGCLGLLIEIVFTSVANFLRRHWKGTGITFIWMMPVYGVTGLLLEIIGKAVHVDWAIPIGVPFHYYVIHLGFIAKAFIYVPIIFGAEALSGWNIRIVTKYLQKWFGGTGGDVIPWEYPVSKWSPMGLINIKYAPFWLLLACSFSLLSDILQRVLAFVATLTL